VYCCLKKNQIFFGSFYAFGNVHCSLLIANVILTRLIRLYGKVLTHVAGGFLLKINDINDR